MRPIIALAAPLVSVVLLGACTPLSPAEPGPATPRADEPAGPAYFALGTEPFWSLEITPATMRFDEANAPGAQIVVATPDPQPSFNGRRYVAPRMTVDVTHAPCSDGMSDRRYADTITLAVDGRAFRGCGGTILPPADLAGTAWRIVSIAGRAVAPDGDAGLQFDGATLTGSASCNRFSGSYSSDGKRLVAGPFAITEMACPGAPMALEQAALAILATPMSVRFAPDGRMVLMGEAGKAIVLEQAL